MPSPRRATAGPGGSRPFDANAREAMAGTARRDPVATADTVRPGGALEAGVPIRETIMRKIAILASLTVALVGAGCSAADWEPAAMYRAEVDVTLFYDVLAPHGDWSWVTPWGWVWSPRGVPAGWRPYTHGRWVFTDLGWTWISDWPWGWAPFHYGRWVRPPGVGWIWVPGREWAPAWVAWRWGEGWIGWAPLPPAVTWRADVGLELNGVDLRLSAAPESWVFVETPRLLSPRLSHEIADRARNQALLGATRDVTRYQPRGAWPAEHGVMPEDVERELRRAVPRFRLEDLAAPPGRAASKPREGVVGVYRPRVAAAPAGRHPRATRPPRNPPRNPPGGPR
jgi:hypothetical protein